MKKGLKQYLYLRNEDELTSPTNKARMILFKAEAYLRCEDIKELTPSQMMAYEHRYPEWVLCYLCTKTPMVKCRGSNHYFPLKSVKFIHFNLNRSATTSLGIEISIDLIGEPDRRKKIFYTFRLPQKEIEYIIKSPEKFAEITYYHLKRGFVVYPEYEKDWDNVVKHFLNESAHIFINPF